MSKRSMRLAAIAGLALSVGSMAPAMALRITGVAGADVDVDPSATVGEVTAILDTLPVEIPTLPSTGSVLLLAGGVLNIPNTLLGTTLLGTAGIVDAANLESVLPECGLVAVASCNEGDTSLSVPVNVLGSGINTGDLGLNVLAPVVTTVAAPIANVLNGGLLGGEDGLGFLGSLLNVNAEGSVGLGVLSMIGL